MRYAIIIVLAALVVSCSGPKQSNNENKNTDLAGELMGKMWILERFPDTTFGKLARPITLVFDNNIRVSGYAGCNSYSGAYSITGEQITFRDIISTKMWCDNGPLEQRFLNVLNTATAVALSGENMQLLQGKNMVAVFRSELVK